VAKSCKFINEKCGFRKMLGILRTGQETGNFSKVLRCMQLSHCWWIQQEMFSMHRKETVRVVFISAGQFI